MGLDKLLWELKYLNSAIYLCIPGCPSTFISAGLVSRLQVPHKLLQMFLNDLTKSNRKLHNASIILTHCIHLHLRLSLDSTNLYWPAFLMRTVHCKIAPQSYQILAAQRQLLISRNATSSLLLLWHKSQSSTNMVTDCMHITEEQGSRGWGKRDLFAQFS